MISLDDGGGKKQTGICFCIFIIWSYHEYGKEEQDQFSSRFLACSLHSSFQTSSCCFTTPLRKKTSCNLLILVSLSTTELGPSFLYMDFIPTWYLLLIYTKCKIQVESTSKSYTVPLFLFRNPRAFLRNLFELITIGFLLIQRFLKELPAIKVASWDPVTSAPWLNFLLNSWGNTFNTWNTQMGNLKTQISKHFNPCIYLSLLKLAYKQTHDSSMSITYIKLIACSNCITCFDSKYSKLALLYY